MDADRIAAILRGASALGGKAGTSGTTSSSTASTSSTVGTNTTGGAASTKSGATTAASPSITTTRPITASALGGRTGASSTTSSSTVSTSSTTGTNTTGGATSTNSGATITASARITTTRPIPTSTATTTTSTAPSNTSSTTSHSTSTSNRANYRNAKRPYQNSPTSTTPTTSTATTPSTSSIPHSTSTIIVNAKRQRENTALKLIRGVGYHFDDIVPDFIVGHNCCVIFLSVKYHNIHNEYIYKRIKQLNNAFEHRILLLLVDVDNPAAALLQLDVLALRTGFQLVLSWSYQEVAKYLALFKQQENASEQAISGQKREAYREQLVEVINRISKSRINKTDAVALVNNFGSLKNAVLDGGQNLELIHGWGTTKANNFREAITQPFINHKNYDMKPYESK